MSLVSCADVAIVNICVDVVQIARIIHIASSSLIIAGLTVHSMKIDYVFEPCSHLRLTSSSDEGRGRDANDFFQRSTLFRRKYMKIYGFI